MIQILLLKVLRFIRICYKMNYFTFRILSFQQKSLSMHRLNEVLTSLIKNMNLF